MKSMQAAAPALNPYAPPNATVADTASAAAEAFFFPVSLLKLTVMSVGTLGLYHIYWFYKNWKCVERNFDDPVIAPVRAFFYPIMAYALFDRIREHAMKSQISTRLQAGLLALALFVLSALSRLPDPWWVVTFGAFLPLLPVQLTVNEINRRLTPQADTNSRFGPWNIVGILLGSIVLAAALIGMFYGV